MPPAGDGPTRRHDRVRQLFTRPQNALLADLSPSPAGSTSASILDHWDAELDNHSFATGFSGHGLMHGAVRARQGMSAAYA